MSETAKKNVNAYIISLLGVKTFHSFKTAETFNDSITFRAS